MVAVRFFEKRNLNRERTGAILGWELMRPIRTGFGTNTKGIDLL
jgi:hypothetical protein